MVRRDLWVEREEKMNLDVREMQEEMEGKQEVQNGTKQKCRSIYMG